MSKLVFVLGSAALGLVMSACDGCNEVDTATGAGGTGGAGGATGGTAGDGGDGGRAGMGGMGGAACDGPFENDPVTGFGATCDEACCKIEVICGLTGTCGLLPMDFSCGTEAGDCVGDVILDPMTTCEDIIALATGGNEALLGDALMCVSDDPCFQCGAESCANEAFACYMDMVCSEFVNCVTTNGCMDAGCIGNCEMLNESPATDALFACVQTNCQTECFGMGTGGAGGGGGAGGAGGAMTSGGGN